VKVDEDVKRRIAALEKENQELKVRDVKEQKFLELLSEPKLAERFKRFLDDLGKE